MSASWRKGLGTGRTGDDAPMMRTGGLGGLLERVGGGEVPTAPYLLAGLMAHCNGVARLDRSTGRPDWLRAYVPVGSRPWRASKMARGTSRRSRLDRTN
jgi:hypothetical protein